jgi:hypothetical protein
VEFDNPFFSKCVPLLALERFPKGRMGGFEYQCHKRHIEFRSCLAAEEKEVRLLAD